MRIVALIDLGESTTVVLKVATDLARAFGADLTLLHVATPDTEINDPDDLGGGRGGGSGSDRSRDDVARRLRREQRAMRVFVLGRNRLGVKTVGRVIRSTSRHGRPTARILKWLREAGADMIVVGSRRHGRLRDMLPGGIARRLIRATPCPVVVVPLARASRVSRATVAR